MEQQISSDVLQEKYAKGNEKTELDIFRRVAIGVAAGEKTPALKKKWEEEFYLNMIEGAIGAGRIMSAAGTGITATSINCFVQPVGDSIIDTDENGNPGIYEALKEAAETMRRGGGVGYNFSNIRPKNAFVKGTGSFASGPCSYMNVFDKSCETVESAGARRGAQMGVLNIEHPDIQDFIVAKRTPGRWNNFNVSVFVSNAFMEAKNNNRPWQLVHKAKPSTELIAKGAFQREDGLWVYDTIDASELWNTIMKSTYDFAEPGILFSDNINNDNNLRYVEKITATNPCVTGDTLILTTGGYLPIDSLVGQEVQVWNGFQWSYVTPIVTGTNQEILDLEFSDGTKLSCTPYHKFILSDGTRIEAKDLQLDSKLSKFNFPVINIEGAISIDDKIAYTQGFYSGDGQVGTNRIWLYEEKCNLIPNLAISGFSDQTSSTNLRVMASLNFSPERKDFVPNVGYNIQTRLNWLAGLIDSDGSVQDKAVTIWSVDRNFLVNVKFLLNTLGASGVISLGKKAETKLMPNGGNGMSLYNCQDCWRLIISGTHISNLRDIGLTTNRVDISGTPNRESGRFIQLTFKQKRSKLEEKVYCFNEELNHSGIFNGLMTANCGEQPLPAYGCCDLGPIILTKFVSNPFTPEATFKYESFEKAVAIQVRFLDNVLDTTHWPLEKQANEANNTRRIGVGFTGLGNCLAMLNLRYSSPEGITEARKIAVAMRYSAYTASVKLAKEKGKFPVFDADKYLEEGTFASRLPENIKELIRKHGIRNSHLLSIAPTGTVSLAFADNASNGIEPPFSLAYSRKKRNQDGTHTFYAVQDHSLRVFLSTLADKNFADIILSTICEYNDSFSYKGKDYKVKDVLPKSIVTALELSVDEHMAMMAAIQPYIDTSISKTVNIPADYPFDDFKKVYDKAHNFHLKGISTYRPNNILGSVLSVGKPKEEEPIRDIFTEAEQFMNGRVEKRPNDSLDAINRKCEYYGPDGKIQFYISISFIKKSYPVDGVDVEIMRPIEVFVTVAPDDVPSEWINVFSRNLSLLARSDFKIFCKSLIDSKKIKSDKGKIRYGTYRKATGEVVPRFHSSDVALMAYAIQEILMDKNIVDETGVPNSVDELLKATKVVETTVEQATKVVQSNQVVPGKTCTECGAAAVIKRDGCTICTNCGHIGSCG